ncbi:MAG: class I SAM-dependent methyltransferase [Sporichthyaceae bacterium]
MSTPPLAAHWDDAYRSRGEDGVSWFRTDAAASLRALDLLGVGADASVVDVGGGASVLVDVLLDRGHRDVTVLDLSAVALAAARERLGAAGEGVQWLTEDLLAWRPSRHWDVWHDRAVFHFLVEPDARRRYVEALRAATTPGARVVLATFALDGPTQCSGLDVARYDAAGLAAELGPEFALTASFAEEHATPWGSAQAFTWAGFARIC